MIIGLSGKKQHGKDTVAKIIQWLTQGEENQADWDHDINHFLRCEPKGFNWERKQFASKLKQIVALLIGCTLEQFEDNKFKETPLGEEWMRWCTYLVTGTLISISNTQEEAVIEAKKWNSSSVKNEYLTPRKMLQIIGTEAGRDLVHPNLWVNALMSDYKGRLSDGSEYNWSLLKEGKYISNKEPEYLNWIITDVRFENEAKAIKDRQGLLFRVERSTITSMDTHPSETSLDNYMQFTDYIRNDGTIEDLIEEVRSVLISFNIIK